MDYTEAVKACISKRKYLLNSLFDLEHFTALNESNFKSFTRNAYKRSWQCTMEDPARQCVMEN